MDKQENDALLMKNTKYFFIESFLIYKYRSNLEPKTLYIDRETDSCKNLPIF